MTKNPLRDADELFGEKIEIYEDLGIKIEEKSKSNLPLIMYATFLGANSIDVEYHLRNMQKIEGMYDRENYIKNVHVKIGNKTISMFELIDKYNYSKCQISGSGSL